jgi:hypothetical protein
MYVCDIAVEVMSDVKSQNFSAERKNAIKEIGSVSEALIIEFIEKAKQYQDENIACWLCCETEAEMIEIVRRASKNDLRFGLPKIWRKQYPLLYDYLSDDFAYCDDALMNYFKDYRRLKIANHVDVDFVNRAYDFKVSQSVPSRDIELQKYSNDINTALLVVDGMGAEYIPLILSIANRYSLNIKSVSVAKANLPTSTEFNRIIWDENRVLESIPEIDNISHDGAVKHGNRTNEQNIVASLAVFENVINSVATALTTYEHVVLTADHGSSRLAVLAHQQGLIKTLSWNGEPLDWRYSKGIENKELLEGFESFYDIDSNVTYWCVKGYNRLPKKGGKLSVHGGASMEERLVPIVVFMKNKIDMEPKKQYSEQLIEKDDYDI